MKIVKAGYEILDSLDGAEIIRKIERCGRVCYKSEDKISAGSAEQFVRGIIRLGHESVLEHAGFTVKFIVDRGVSHELVRHRIVSFSQESTRHCNYADGRNGGEIAVIEPFFLTPDTRAWYAWERACLAAEQAYFGMLDFGCSPQEARSVLPNSLKTEVVMTANLREWRHFLRLRTSTAAHPQMREVTVPLLAELRERIPEVFDDAGAP